VTNIPVVLLHFFVFLLRSAPKAFLALLFNSGLAYWLNRAVGESHDVVCPSALIGASNFFEPAVAAAISPFGFSSGAVLATVWQC